MSLSYIKSEGASLNILAVWLNGQSAQVLFYFKMRGRGFKSRQQLPYLWSEVEWKVTVQLFCPPLLIRQSCYMFLLLPSFPIALAYWRVHNSYVKYDHVKLNATHIPTWSDVSSYMNAECLWLIAIIILPHNHFLFKIYFMMREQRRSHHNFPLCLRQSPFIETARGWRAIKLPYILIHLLGGDFM